MNFQISSLGDLRKILFLMSIVACSYIAEASTLVSDDFNSATNEPNPTWIFHDPYANESGEAKLTMDGAGNAIIDIPEGLAHDLWTPSSNNKAPRLLQPAPDTDFEFEVKFETAPKVTHQMQGIVIQNEGGDVFLRFDIYYNVSGLHLFVAYVDGITNTTAEFTSIDLPAEVGFPKYRRVKRIGDRDWRFSYSSTGNNDWSHVNVTLNQNQSESFEVEKVGFFAGTAGAAGTTPPKFLSSVDYFIDLDDQSPSIDVDTWTQPAFPPPRISTWHAQPAMKFGQAGISQKWVNILGNVSSDINIATLSHTINGGIEKAVPFGSSGFDFRLENKGDFNIEIDRTSLEPGSNNTVTIKAKDSDDQVTTKIVTIEYTPAGIGLPPYTADWGLLENIRNVDNIAHIVDGLWELTVDGIKTKEKGYDRAIAIGDVNWFSDNYVVTVPFIPHSDFDGIGFGVGWQGHETNAFELTRSPRIGWPVQALVWVRGSIAVPSLEIITYGEGLSPKNWEVPVGTMKNLAPLIINKKYWLKSYSEPLGNNMSRFHVKFWKDGDTEPSTWSIYADVPTRDGSILLVSYNGNVTFGNVSIKEHASTPSVDNTAPVISGIKVTKTDSVVTIYWETDKPSNSVVEYGLTNSYGLNKTDSSQTKMHSLSLTGLNSNVEYHFRVKSADSSNNTTSSEDHTFFISASTYKLPRNEWHLISLPMNPDVKNKVSDIFGKDELGKYGTSWAVFHYDASNKSYVDLGLNGEMEQGMGYWIIQMSSTTKTLDMPAGSLSTQVDVSGKFEIPLVTKDSSSLFNMIGYPFNAKGHFKDARIETNENPCDSDSGCTKDIAYAKNNKILHNELWTYSGGSGYIKINTTNGSLVPWQGFWAETLSGADGKEPSLLFSKPENSNN